MRFCGFAVLIFQTILHDKPNVLGISLGLFGPGVRRTVKDPSPVVVLHQREMANCPQQRQSQG
jgi:hypothetical protein